MFHNFWWNVSNWDGAEVQRWWFVTTFICGNNLSLFPFNGNTARWQGLSEKQGKMALTGNLPFFKILEIISSGPVAEDSFIFSFMWRIPLGVIKIGGNGSEITGCEEREGFISASVANTEENALFSVIAVSLSVSSSFLSSWVLSWLREIGWQPSKIAWGYFLTYLLVLSRRSFV